MDGEDQYILSSGAQSLNSTGFAVLNFHGNFTGIWSQRDREWDIKIPKKDIPLDERINIVFVWNESSDSLSFFMNGKLIKKVRGRKSDRPRIKYTILTISRPNNSQNKRFMMPLQISYLALWDRSLTEAQVKSIYTNGNYFCLLFNFFLLKLS